MECVPKRVSASFSADCSCASVGCGSNAARLAGAGSDSASTSRPDCAQTPLATDVSSSSAAVDSAIARAGHELHCWFVGLGVVDLPCCRIGAILCAWRFREKPPAGVLQARILRRPERVMVINATEVANFDAEVAAPARRQAAPLDIGDSGERQVSLPFSS